MRDPVPTSVLIVDDSEPVRRVLTRLLEGRDGLHVVATAGDAFEARDLIVDLSPDVVILDVQMPRMDGITFLRKLLAVRPIPVVVVSALTDSGGHLAFEALQAGAVDIMFKPSALASLEHFAEELARKVNVAATSRPLARASGAQPLASATSDLAAHALLAIGASTGGPVALVQILSSLPRECPPIVIAQHMPPGFTATLAARLDAHSAISVREAREGDLVAPGIALLAPGDRHMIVRREHGALRVRLPRGESMTGCRPSVDLLFASCARAVGPACVGAVLTGMGHDGARGVEAIATAGGVAITQDEETSVVWGMPREAARTGCVSRVTPLEHIADAMLQAAAGSRARSSV